MGINICATCAEKEIKKVPKSTLTVLIDTLKTWITLILRLKILKLMCLLYHINVISSIALNKVMPFLL